MSVDQPYADGFDEETQKTLDGTCPECPGRITSDGGEKACQDCGPSLMNTLSHTVTNRGRSRMGLTGDALEKH